MAEMSGPSEGSSEYSPEPGPRQSDSELPVDHPVSLDSAFTIDVLGGFGTADVSAANPNPEEAASSDGSGSQENSKRQPVQADFERHFTVEDQVGGTPQAPEPVAGADGKPGRLQEEEEEEEEDEGESSLPGRDAWERSRPKSQLTPEEAAEADRRIAETVLASPRNDDPWNGPSEDLLGFGDDARAFARLAASKDVEPPLAVAVFGSWGSGKSFFLRLIREHVQRLSAGVPDAKAPEATSDKFHRNIAQISFNAWHYAETNIWASLVDHLFSELSKYALATPGGGNAEQVISNLTTTRTLTIDAAERLASQRKAQEALSKKLASNEAERSRLIRQELLAPAALMELMQEVIDGDESLKAELQGAAKGVGVGELQEKAAKFVNQVAASQTLLGRARTIFQEVRHRVGLLGASLLFMSIPVAPLLVWTISKALRGGDAEFLSALISAAGTGLVAATSILVWAVKVARPVLAKMESVKAKVDAKFETTLAKADADVIAAKQDLAASAGRLASAVEDFYGSTGAERLRRFLKTRATDGQYAQHLGLVASVRRDFEELSRGLKPTAYPKIEPINDGTLEQRLEALHADESGLSEDDRKLLPKLLASSTKDGVTPDSESRAAAKESPPAFSRLVLYIDDLDRCSPEKVIEVLQAVHMLLAFPLFTVFVAVDVRWLSHALMSQYGDMLSPLRTARDKDRAAPHDYLEKIFQLPYWIEEVTQHSGNKLLEGLLPVEDEDLPEDAASPTALEGAKAGRPATATPSVRSLQFRQWHRDLVGLFLPYFVTSPRKLLWFVNAFRVLKATSLPLSEAQESQHDFAIITQLALAAISPKEYHKWLSALASFTGQVSLRTMFERTPKSSAAHVFWAAAEKAAEYSELNHFEDFDPETLRQYASRAHRFCFSVPEPLNTTLADVEGAIDAEDKAQMHADDNLPTRKRRGRRR